MLVTKEQIAKFAHEVNRAYCAALGDTTQPLWEEAPDWQKQSALAGVEMHLANPLATPEQSHESWLALKVADGWVYGEVKDPDKKTHPCCVPYEQLPEKQKAKDYLFRAVVHQLAGLPAPQQPIAKLVAAPDVKADNAHVPVKYIGRRDNHKENLYGTNLLFQPGQTRLVPAVAALKMMRAHPDVYAPGDEAAAPTALPPATSTKTVDNEEQNLQDVRDSVGQMSKDALVMYAKTHNIPVAKTASKADILAAVTQHIDRFGVPA